MGHASPHGEPIRPLSSHTFGLPTFHYVFGQAPAEQDAPQRDCSAG